MKILHVYKDFDPPVHGGMERHIALMCRFQREWAEVEALTCSRTIHTVNVIREGTAVTEVAEFGRFQSAPIAPAFPYYLRAARADLIVMHVPNPTAEVAYLLARPKAPFVVRYHSDVVRQASAMRLYRPLFMNFVGRAAMILPTSQQYVESSPYLQQFRELCRVVPLGIVPEEFEKPKLAEVRRLREFYGSFVLFSGRHRYYKGLDYLIEAAGAIDAAVVIAGDGPERARIEAQAKRSKGRIVFVGSLSQEDLVNHLHACAVFAFPSIERSEAFGISILEAHACGKPVVATTLGTGVEFANLDGKTGLNVPPRDPVAFAAAVNELLHDSTRADEYGRFARARVKAEFDARDIAKKEFNLYQEVLECRKIGI